jgi:opacity protein-like surface antigen
MIKKLLAAVALVVGMSATAIELGATYSVPKTNRMDSDIGYVIKTTDALYGWADYNSNQFRLLGQRMGAMKVYSLGLGLRYDTGKIGFFGEFGYFYPKADPLELIQDEAVARALVNQFGDNHFDNTNYDLEPSMGGRVGINYRPFKNIEASLSYRFVQFQEELDAWDGTDPEPIVDVSPNFWQTRGFFDYGGAEFGVMVRF